MANWYESIGLIDWANKYKQNHLYLRTKEQVVSNKNK